MESKSFLVSVFVRSISQTWHEVTEICLLTINNGFQVVNEEKEITLVFFKFDHFQFNTTYTNYFILSWILDIHTLYQSFKVLSIQELSYYETYKQKFGSARYSSNFGYEFIHGISQNSNRYIPLIRG